MRKNQASQFFESLLPPWAAIFEHLKVCAYEPIELFYEFLHTEL